MSVHYVSQEVMLTPAQEEYKPADLIVEADVERRLLLVRRVQVDPSLIPG